MSEQEAVRIPYTEYRAAGELLRAHLKTHEKQLRALIAFGPLVTRGSTYDIDLLEVVDGWAGPHFVTFRSTTELPLRGLLRLNVVSTQDLETPSHISDTNTKRHLDEVLIRLQQGYEVIYENPFGFIERVLSRADEAVLNVNPLTFLDMAVMQKEAV